MNAARPAAAVLSLATIALWVVFIAANSFGTQGLTPETVAVALIMVALAAAGLERRTRRVCLALTRSFTLIFPFSMSFSISSESMTP